MQLNDLLNAMDAAAANLAKLETIWRRVEPMIPDGNIVNANTPEYLDLARHWDDLRASLPPISGWRLTADLPDPEDVGLSLIDLDPFESMSVWQGVQECPRQLGEYRFRLAKARKEAVRGRLVELVAVVDTNLPVVLAGVPRNSQDPLAGPVIDLMKDAVREVERLVGDTVQRSGRWNDLHRHMSFSLGLDWHDVAELDWPAVKKAILVATVDELDPVPTPAIDLGHVASSNPTGPVTTGLSWDTLDAEGFERLLYNLLGVLPGYQNVQWQINTNATDRGRDISVERVIADAGGGVRTERVIVQAKHWRSRSVSAPAVSDTLAQVRLWQPPLIHSLIIATSGKFSSDAVAWYEQHNQQGQLPLIETWADSHLERLLAQHPGVAAAAGLL